jgi:UDP-N-acetylmuramoyl-tripeptide--D-alanyl-D-alanine ligase
MAELGNESEEEHKALVKQIGGHTWKEVILVGNEFEKVSHRFHQFKNSDEVRDWMQQQKFKNTNILIKGSRSMQMEKVLKE